MGFAILLVKIEAAGVDGSLFLVGAKSFFVQ